MSITTGQFETGCSLVIDRPALNHKIMNFESNVCNVICIEHFKTTIYSSYEKSPDTQVYFWRRRPVGFQK